MNKTLAKKYLSTIKAQKRKYLTCEDLSDELGKFPETIASELSAFDPLILMDMSSNLKDIVPIIEQYIEEENNKSEVKASKPVVRVTQKDISGYQSITDFIYQKMTYGGTFDRNAYLTDKDLKALKKLINEEQKRRKEKK